MPITNTTSQLIRDEGFRSSVYQDSLGYWTIGVGTCVDARKNCGLLSNEIAFILNNRIQLATTGLSQEFPWTDALDDVRRAVLINMSFQMGLHGLGEFRDMLEALQTGNYQSASEALLNSEWAKTEAPARAQRLALQLTTGTWQ